MKFRPLHDRVVVKRIEAEEKTAGGIIIPDTAKGKPQQGEVVSVGQTCVRSRTASATRAIASSTGTPLSWWPSR